MRITGKFLSEIQEDTENDSIQMKHVKKTMDQPAREPGGYRKVRAPSRGISTFMDHRLWSIVCLVVPHDHWFKLFLIEWSDYWEIWARSEKKHKENRDW